MQTTLLGLAIAMILALVAALVGPAYVDWDTHRSAFEAEASRVAGQPVRIGGAIDVRILPVPSAVLREIEVGPRATPLFGARALRVEFALGSLMRGEWRAAALRLDGLDANVGLNSAGKIDIAARALGFDPDRVSIDRVVIDDGRITLDDVTSGARTTLEKFAFDGEVRSLGGPIRGEGHFVASAQPYNFQITVGRHTDSGARVKLNLDPADRPLSFEADGTLSIEQNAPRFDGTVALSRPAGLALASGKTVASDPWRIGSRVRADAASALFQQVEIQYGPEERAVRLSGTADLKLGSAPRLDGVVSARQIDLDRALASADAANRLPLGALRSLAQAFGDSWRPPIPVSIGVGIDSVMLGGAPVQTVRGDVKTEDGAWRIDTFEFRAPGLTQVKLSGRVDGAQQSVQYSGPVAVDSVDPRALLSWLQGSERKGDPLGALHAHGSMTLGRERIAADDVSAEFDGKAFSGRFGYTFATAAHSSKLDAALRAADFDIDGAIAVAATAFAGEGIERPGEMSLAIDVGHATYAGLDAQSVTANLRYGAAGLAIDRLIVGDFGGAALTGTGTIDLAAMPPQGSVTMAVDAQKLDGVCALLAKVAPRASAFLRRNAQSFLPAKVTAAIKVEPAPGGGAQKVAKLTAAGTAGAMRIDAAADAAGAFGDSAGLDLKANVTLASDNGALLAALGLDRVLGPDKRPASLNVGVSGRTGRDLRVTARLAGEALAARADGTFDWGAADASAKVDLAVQAADLRGLRRDRPFPVDLKAHVAIAGDTAAFEDVSGSAGGSSLRGRLTATLSEPIRLDGAVTADTLDVPAVLASALAMPAAGAPAVWSPQSFGPRPLQDVSGRIAFDAAQAALSPGITVRNLHGVALLAPAELSFETVTGGIGGGTLSAQAEVRGIGNGLSVHAKLAVANADAAAVLRSGVRAPVAGRLSADLDLDGAGASPATLVGALRGSGSLSLDAVQVAGLSPRAIDVAVRAVERGMPIAPDRIADVIGRVLDGGALALPSVRAPLEMTAGRLRLGKVALPPQADDLGVNASLDLADATLDARFVLAGVERADTPVRERPEIAVAFKGPIDAPQRTIDVSALVGWLTLQSVDRESKRLEAAERAAREEREARDRAAKQLEETREPSGPPPSAAPAAPPLPGPIEIPPARSEWRLQAGPRADSTPRAEPVPSRPLPVSPTPQ